VITSQFKMNPFEIVTLLWNVSEFGYQFYKLDQILEACLYEHQLALPSYISFIFKRV
jgi:hypothetical protein